MERKDLVDGSQGEPREELPGDVAPPFHDLGHGMVIDLRPVEDASSLHRTERAIHLEVVAASPGDLCERMRADRGSPIRRLAAWQMAGSEPLPRRAILRSLGDEDWPVLLGPPFLLRECARRGIALHIGELVLAPGRMAEFVMGLDQARRDWARDSGRRPHELYAERHMQRIHEAARAIGFAADGRDEPC